MARFFNKKPDAKRHPTIEGKKSPYIYRSRSAAYAQGEVRREPGSSKSTAKFSKRLGSVTFVLIFIVFIAAVVFMSVLDSKAKVVIKGNQPPLRTLSEYVEGANEILSSSLNNRWKVSLNRNEVSSAMKARFPEIEEANISTPPWSYKPIVELTMSEPTLILENGGTSYLVNSSGIAVSSAKNAVKQNSDNKLPTVIDETGHVAEVGKNVLSTEQVDFIEEVIFQTRNKKLSVKSIRLKPGGEEVHFYFKGLKYFVKFSFSNDARRSAGAFLALKKYLDSKGQPPSIYIDVRVSERAYVM